MMTGAVNGDVGKIFGAGHPGSDQRSMQPNCLKQNLPRPVDGAGGISCIKRLGR